MGLSVANKVLLIYMEHSLHRTSLTVDILGVLATSHVENTRRGFHTNFPYLQNMKPKEKPFLLFQMLNRREKSW
jgi:hypothetical protein